MTRLRGAIVGFGNVATNGHWPALAATPEIEVVAVVDRSEARRAAAAALGAGRIRTYASIEELSASGEPIDFVDIATPPSSHVPLAQLALARGWHVACEKPLTLDPAEFARLAADARSVDRTLFTMHNWKAAPIVTAALQELEDGRIGCVRHVDILVLRNQPCKGVSDEPPQVTQEVGPVSREPPQVWGEAPASPHTAKRPPRSWREDPTIAGGGILVDHGWHSFYLLLRLVGAEPTHVSASLTRPFDDPRQLDDSARLLVSFPRATAFLHLTWRAPARRNAMLLYGDCGSLAIDDDRLIVCARDAAPEVVRFAPGLSAGSHHEDWFRGLLPDFVREVREPGERGRNLREAGWCVALTHAAYRSGAEDGRTVAVCPSTLPAA